MMYDEPLATRRRGYKARLLSDSECEGDPERQAEADAVPDEPTDDNPANLVASLCADGLHRPALDIDVPVRLVPSSTSDHWHLYFPTVKLTEAAYFDLLDALEAAGILGKGFVAHSKRRGATWLRLPDVKKDAPA